ncbi:MAG TPA: chitobiase/beta-hexosaminidase C-terminal domain-containing protein [Nocardioidaceae bacterium]|nr:chitobiase/beta-hexosaminidase C-terminal domain-containing protein [Nocardioidaceae bacterium]
MNRSPHNKHRRRSALVASAALAASAVSALPAIASETGDGVRDGHSIMVMHNIDFIAIAGYADGTELTVEVLRNGVPISTTVAPALPGETEGDFGLEINHGPEAAVRPGDCFAGFTPDVRPGDVVRVTDVGGSDEITVDDMAFSSQPFLARNGDVLVEGHARTFDGAAIPLAQLDSAEFRDGSRFRIFANEVRLTARPDEVGGFTLRYPIRRTFERNRDNLTPQQIQQILLNVDGHAIGFGHIEPAPADAQMVEGLGDTPGPAPGCEEAPSARWGVTNVTPANLNLANRASGVTVRGVSHDSSEVTVNLTDATGTTASKVVTTTAATGASTWTAAFTAAELAGLDGDITVSGVHSFTGGPIGGASETMVKDLVRPDRPTASLPAGVFRGTQRVALNAAPGEQIRYTLGNGRQARPTANSGNLYNNRLRITSDQTLKMVAVDEAGNASPVARLRFRIGNVPSKPRTRRASSGAPGGRATAVARWRAPQFANGSRVTGYRVQALRLRRNGSVASARQTRVLPRNARSLQMRLRRGNYRFRVQAVNALGSSRLSRPSNQVRAR